MLARNQVSPRGSGSNARTVWSLTLAALLALALTFAACGDDDSDDGGGSAEPSADAPTGEPIKVMTMTSIEAQDVPTFENISITASAYEEWANQNGGIAGRPLEVTVCDDQGDPSQATRCGREAIRDGAVASVGSFTFFGDAIVPVLEKSDTAWFGICCAQSAAELTSENVFPMGSQPLYGAGAVARAIEDDCQTLNAAIVEGAEPVFQPVMEGAAASYGRELDKVVTIPAAAQDYAPQVAELTDGDADCIIAIFGETLYGAFMPAFQQTGSEARLYGAQGNLNLNAVEGFEDLAEGWVIAGIYPDLSTDPFTDYQEALDLAGAPDDEDYNSLGGLGTWAAFTGFKQIAEGIDGDITPESFLKATAETTELDTNGMVPVLDFTQPWGSNGGPEGFDRLFNCSVVFSEITGGEIEPLTTEFQNAGALSQGEAELPEPGEGSGQCGAANDGS